MAENDKTKKKGIISKLLGKKDKKPVVEEKGCGCCCGCSEEKSGEDKGCCG
jgi:hypothetical protein